VGVGGGNSIKQIKAIERFICNAAGVNPMELLQPPFAFAFLLLLLLLFLENESKFNQKLMEKSYCR
jgi:hypothetical protein